MESPKSRINGRESRVDSSEFKVKSPKFKMESAAKLLASVARQDSIRPIVCQVVNDSKAMEKRRKALTQRPQRHRERRGPSTQTADWEGAQ